MTDTGFSRPTLQTLIDRVFSDINTRLPEGDARTRPSLINVLGTAIAKLIHNLYGYVDWVARQVIPDTAESEALERWGAIVAKPRLAASKATGPADIIGIDGSLISTGTLIRTLSEVEYITTEATTIASGVGTLTLEATTAGIAGNLDAGAKLYFVEPIDGVNTEAVGGAMSGGTDDESDEDYRARVLDRFRQPPMGGADYDYIAWAKEVAGVTRAWVSGFEIGDNSVTVRFMTDDLTVNGIPSGGMVTTVGDYIETKRPVTVDLYVVAPTAVPLNFTIRLKDADGATETSTTIRDAVEAELLDMILRDGAPGEPILFSHIREAISIAAGEYDHTITVPSADVTHTTGQIPTMGTITWSA